MPDYSFARRPRWLATHLLVAAVVVGMVSLGFWQLRRLDERREHNALIEARSQQETVPVDELPADLDAARFRAVEATGEYDVGEGIVVRSRTQAGAPGGWLVSPLRLPSGAEVAVLRGFTRFSRDGTIAEPPPPAGEVSVEGWAIPISRLDRLARTDLESLAEGRAHLLPIVLQMADSRPADDGSLEPVPLSDLGEGPHLSYAVQWFLFAAVVLVGYPFLLRREARRGGVPDEVVRAA
ncbi:MAG: SURF1 family protein [Acidimicrobiales bacterium]